MATSGPETRKGKRTGRARGAVIARRLTQAVFLALFVFLVFKSAYPPLSTPPANIFLRFDPLAGLFALLVARSFSVFLRFWPAWILLGLTALSGRFFCGWICPLGTCFDAVGTVKPKALKYYRPSGGDMKERLALSRSGKSPRRFRIKYLLLALVLGLALAGVNLLYFASPIVIANRSIYYILLPQVPVLLIIMLLIAFFYRPRFWCEDICPMGALMSLVSMAGKRLGKAASPLAVTKDSGACIECGACYRECDFDVAEPYVKADDGRLRSADCTACGECVAVCPSDGALSLESFGHALFRSRGVARVRRARRAGRSARVENAGDRGGLASGKGVAGSEPSEGTGGLTVPPEAESRRLTVSRGEFIASVGLAAAMVAGYGVGLKAADEVVLRMPGAQNEALFLAECNRCAECARVCPAGCLKPMGLDGGLQKLWTPRFVPRTAACVFDQCDQACARVCPAGAITRLKAEEVRIGVARVNRRTCLGWRSEVCLVCQERCRFNAIEANGLRPVVLADACTGCGACEQTCPTEPASIFIVPVGNTINTSPSTGNGGSDKNR